MYRVQIAQPIFSFQALEQARQLRAYILGITKGAEVLVEADGSGHSGPAIHILKQVPVDSEEMAGREWAERKGLF